MNQRGFSLLELLIALFMLGIILGITGTYFAQQANLQRRTQARSEVQEKVRMVMQYLTQDLANAGASVYTNHLGSVNTDDVSLASCSIIACLEGTDGGARDTAKMYYITSMRATTAGPEACRDVQYSFDGGTLERSDEECATPRAAAVPLPIADSIVALDIVFVCSNGVNTVSYPDDINCPRTGVDRGYPRSAIVTVIGRSNVRIPGAPQTSFTTPSGQTVTCGPDFFCFEQTQEVLLPNMKGI